MEACSGANYWGRELIALGFTVKLIPPQYVKPFVKGNKNDRNDALAITEAARRPQLRGVQPRSLAQTDMIQVHRARERIVGQRVALSNQIRGFLAEYGVVLPRGKRPLLEALPRLLEDADNGLTVSARQLIDSLWEEWRQLDAKVRHYDQQIGQQAKQNPSARRLMNIHGVAEKTATAAVAFMGEGYQYRNGRHFASNLGVVPKEHSSGGKQRLGSISKRGNGYLRRLLVQGAWSVLRNADKRTDRLSRWAKKVAQRRGKHKAALAIANKLARIIWAMHVHKTDYRAA
jgi:transposase